MVDGTSRPRTIVASAKTASAMPRPSALIWITSAASENDPATATTIAAAPVITRALAPMALVTDWVLFRVTRYSSRTRLNKNTS